MSRGLGIGEVSLTKIILVLMDNQGTPKEVLGFDIRKVIGIVGFGLAALHISQIPRMPRALGARLGSMVWRRPYMKMLTGPQTSLASQIARLVYMETMKALGQLGKGHTKTGALSFGFGNGISMNGGFFEHSNSNRHPY
jgi:hypothetical protein